MLRKIGVLALLFSLVGLLAITACDRENPVAVNSEESVVSEPEEALPPKGGIDGLQKVYGDPLKWPRSIRDFKLPFSGRHNTCAPEYWKVICGYGCYKHKYWSYPRAGYYSIDLDRQDGRTIDSAVLSSARGKVAFSGVKSGYGNCVEIDHGRGFKSIYAHLRENPGRYVRTGDDLRAGTFLGWASNSGTGYPHIHFGVWRYNKPISLDGISGYYRIRQGRTYCSGLARVSSPRNSPF